MGRGLPSHRFIAGAFMMLVPRRVQRRGRRVPPRQDRPDHRSQARRRGRSPATDAEFLRRIYLDLAGMIPTSAEARAFLDDPSAYKRQKLIDRLLAGPDYARRMQDVFDAMLMERRDDTHVPASEWQAFLRRAFADNLPYDRLVSRDPLGRRDRSQDPTEPRSFTSTAWRDPNLLTRDVGRMFLGRDIQCAQCHDHPLIDDYKQAHYYGIFAFLNRTSLFEDRHENRRCSPRRPRAT